MPRPAEVVKNEGHWARACCGLAGRAAERRVHLPDSGVSFLKTLKRKTETKVCNLDLEAMQGSQLPVLALGLVGDHGAWVSRRGLMLWFYSLSPVSSFGPVLVNLFFILLDLVT